jgi:ATP-dependent RNA helicase DeaD
MITFKNFNLSDGLSASIDRMGFQCPTQIQQRAIPLILNGRDVMGESATGSGKTLAFGCGVVEQSMPGRGLQSLILTPTRELAEQVKNSLCELSYTKGLSIISVYGGVSIEPQIQSLRNADVVIATPGRFKDHLQRGTVNTARIKVLVLDEADRMLDMGFIEDIEDIISTCPRNRQTLFFSATFSPKIEHLAKKYLHDPLKVLAKKQVDPSKLEQVYYDVSRGLKFSLLLHLIRSEKSDRIMVFCNTRKSADLVVKNLVSNRVNAVIIHGGFAQNKRTKSIERFMNSCSGVLVCTDVAARGLHIENVSHIYNYDIPNDPTDYVHRIGRTARAGESGKVINLLCDRDYDNFSRILTEHRSFTIQKMKRPYIEQIPVQKERRAFSGPKKKDFKNNRRRF